MSLDYVRLGETGLQVSELAFGTWRFGRETDQGTVEIDEDCAYSLLDAYDEAGGRFIDTADMYGDGKSETWIGNWLGERDRADYVLASKVYWPTREDNPTSRASRGRTSADRSTPFSTVSAPNTSIFSTSTAGTRTPPPTN